MEKIKEKIATFSSFDEKDIDNYIKTGIKLEKNLDISNCSRQSFGIYCRNMCNFLINHTEFNYLIEVYNETNSNILKNFKNNIIYAKIIISYNNYLLKMIKSNDFCSKMVDNEKYTKWQPLDDYLFLLKNINTETFEIIKYGDNKPMRIWVDTKVLEDRINKLEDIQTNNIVLYDIYRYYLWIAYKYLSHLEKKNQKKKIETTNKFINRFKYLCQTKTDRLAVIIQTIRNFQQDLIRTRELADILPKEELDKNDKKYLNNLIINGGISVGSIIATAAVLYKVLN